MTRAGKLALSMLLLSGCVEKAQTPAPGPAAERPVPQQALPVQPPAAAREWGDIPLTPGTWTYSQDERGSEALFGARNAVRFIVRCDRPQRRIMLSREGAASGGQIVIRTSFGVRAIPVAVQTGSQVYSSANLAVSDTFLDSMVFSRGRFTVEAPGMPPLVIPSWPEPARVIEDCRG